MRIDTRGAPCWEMLPQENKRRCARNMIKVTRDVDRDILDDYVEVVSPFLDAWLRPESVNKMSRNLVPDLCNMNTAWGAKMSEVYRIQYVVTDISNSPTHRTSKLIFFKIVGQITATRL